MRSGKIKNETPKGLTAKGRGGGVGTGHGHTRCDRTGCIPDRTEHGSKRHPPVPAEHRLGLLSHGRQHPLREPGEVGESKVG